MDGKKLTLYLRVKYIVIGWFNWITQCWFDFQHQSLYRDRLDICRMCEHNKAGICDVCGCIVKAKTKVYDMECPENKW